MSADPMEVLSCSVCGQGPVEATAAFDALPRVTSDCRPFPAGGRLGLCRACGAIQKPADAAWFRDAGEIYGRYDMFRQAVGGAEQAVFSPTGTSTRRSSVVLERMHTLDPMPASGEAIDVGCGNGAMLRAIADVLPGWTLYGHELSDAGADALSAIPGFRKLFTGELSELPGRYGLITLSQSLEHFPDPVAALVVLRAKLAPGGRLLVQVPNARLNIFDLPVADHRTHFDPGTLEAAARRAGFAHVAVADDWVFKELTMTCSDSPIKFGSSPRKPQLSADELTERVEWLASVVDEARRLAERSESFGLFGSSIAATWLFGAMPQRVAFFVDEDTMRIGQRHEGTPIVAPAQVPRGATVYVPLVPQMAEPIAARLVALGVDARAPSRPFPFT